MNGQLGLRAGLHYGGEVHRWLVCSHLEATEDKKEREPDGSDGAEAMKAAKTNNGGREDEQMGIGKEVKTRRPGPNQDRWQKKGEDSCRPGSKEKTGRICKGGPEKTGGRP